MRSQAMEEVHELWQEQRVIVAFLCDHWSNYVSSQLYSLQFMYVTSRDECYVFTSGDFEIDPVMRQDVPELQCGHEEADTRLLLHSKHAAEAHDRIIVKTPDTDVLVLCIAKQKTIGKDVFMMTGTGNKFRLIDTTPVSDALGEELCACPPGFHAFTGTVYSMYLIYRS